MSLWPLILVATSATSSHRVLQSSDAPLIMRHPALNQSTIVFEFAGDLWSVPRAGGDAKRITNSVGEESDPCMSPDGTTIAFTGNYDGNADVYLMPVGGGIPRRLTYHPGADIATGWAADGKRVLFVSSYLSNTDLPRLFSVSVEGGLPTPLPFPSGSAASMSPDGGKIAYSPGIQWQDAWKRYRGGQTMPIWIGQMSDSKVQEIPRKNSNDRDPMWVGKKIYFLSDRNGPTTLFAYDTDSKKVSELIKNDGFEFKSASAGPGAIVCEQLGCIKLFDTETGKVQKVSISIAGDFPEVREQYKDLSGEIAGASVSPSGQRAVFQARGEILTVPAAKGDIRDITNTSDAAERDPAWSPDGQSICYLSDESGEYRLAVRDAMGQAAPKWFDLGDAPAFYYHPVWSPDSKKILYSDNRHILWYLDLATGKSLKVDANPYENARFQITGVWSPDSKWIAYHRELDSHFKAVFLYDLSKAKTTQVTDGLSDATLPAFDLNGKYLYFVASTNKGAGAAWLDLSSYGSINTVSSVYCAVLRNDLPSPLEPQSDEEKVANTDTKPADKGEFRIDIDGLDQRVVSLPMPGRNYVDMACGAPGSLFALEVAPLATITSPETTTLWKYDSESRTPTPFARNVGGFAITANGQKMLLATPGSWSIVSTMAPPQPGQGALALAGMRVKIDPRKEWKQMYDEVWRIERDFFYAPNFHGIDLKKMSKKYEPFLENVMSRSDLNYVFTDMLGELSVGHMFINGGDVPRGNSVPGGLLGADYTLENGRYRFARVYNGENWNPGLRAPLTQPGVNVKAGEYLLAIDGRNVTAASNIYAELEGTAGKQVRLKVGPNPDGTGSREVTVVPTPSEGALRTLAWEEDNRRKVAELSGGKVGYVHIPDTNIGGWTNFNRYYFAQVGKEGMVIDERFNHGGQVDDYMVDMMNRPLMSMWTSRYGKDFTSPLSAVYGPKVMLINQYAGSGGDYFPWHFRKVGLGPLIGKRTWGGLVGILNFPVLVDGGTITAPNVAFWNPNGTWDVENHGVDPDIDVDLDPALWRTGHDAQLERAVAEVLDRIKKNPSKTYTKPAYQDKSKLPPSR